MYQKFTVKTVTIHEAKNQIEVNFTYELDEDSISSTSLYITKSNQQEIVRTDLSVDGSKVLMSYGTLEVNTEYSIVATKEIESVMGDSLDIEFYKTFIIEKTVDSTVTIDSPTNHEEIEKIFISFTENQGNNKTLVNRFRLQIAGDHDFLAPLLDVIVSDKTSITISDIKAAKQYYVRIRAEKDDTDYGNWSKKTTFTLAQKTTSDSTHSQDEDDTPIVEDDFVIAGYPENGTTPETFLIEFDDEIDSSSIDISNILLTRRKV